jgi:hypothetical protein
MSDATLQRTARFNDQFAKIDAAKRTMRDFNRIYHACTEADRQLVFRRNAAVRAAESSLFREFADLLHT